GTGAPTSTVEGSYQPVSWSDQTLQRRSCIIGVQRTAPCSNRTVIDYEPHISPGEPLVSQPTPATITLPHWQLDSIYPSLESPQYAGDKEALKAALDSLGRYFSVNGVTGNAVAQQPVPEAGSKTAAVVLDGALDRL